MVLTVKFIAENSNGMVKVNLLGKPQFDHIVSDDDSEIDQLSMERQIALYEIILRDGVYIVYKNGVYEEFDGKNNKENVSFIGIAFGGHTFGVPLDHDYGKQRLLKEYKYPEDEHCVNEAEALLNWDFVGETEYLKQLGLAFELKEGHYIATAPVFLAEYAYREELNKALKYLGAKEVDFGANRRLAHRYSVHSTWNFYAGSGDLGYYGVGGEFQVCAVTPWNP